MYEESQSRLKMSMELDTKESELETIQLKLAHINLDTASLSSGTGDFNELVHHEETSLEGKHNPFSFCLLFKREQAQLALLRTVMFRLH